MKVFVIESGEYEQRGVCAVASSFESGCEAIRAMFAEPEVRVRWTEEKDNLLLRGDFYEHVQHFHCKHEATWTFTEYEVV